MGDIPQLELVGESHVFETCSKGSTGFRCNNNMGSLIVFIQREDVGANHRIWFSHSNVWQNERNDFRGEWGGGKVAVRT